MTENLIKQFATELDRVRASESRVMTLADNLSTLFPARIKLTNETVVSTTVRTIDHHEDCYHLAQTAGALKTRIDGIVTRLRQVGPKANKLLAQCVTTQQALADANKLSYKLLYGMASQVIPETLKERGDAVLEVVKKHFTNASHQVHAVKDTKGDMCYGYYIIVTTNNDINQAYKLYIMLTMVVNHETGEASGIGARIDTQFRKPDEIWGKKFKSDDDVMNELKDFAVKHNIMLTDKGNIQIIDVDKEALTAYDDVIVKNNTVTLVLKTDPRLNKDNKGIINVEPDVLEEALQAVMRATGVGKDKIKYNTTIQGDSAHITFRFLVNEE